MKSKGKHQRMCSHCNPSGLGLSTLSLLLLEDLLNGDGDEHWQMQSVNWLLLSKLGDEDGTEGDERDEDGTKGDERDEDGTEGCEWEGEGAE